MNAVAAVLAVIFFAIALILHLASVSKGVLLSVDTFEILGFIGVAVALVPWTGRFVRGNGNRVA